MKKVVAAVLALFMAVVFTNHGEAGVREKARNAAHATIETTKKTAKAIGKGAKKTTAAVKNAAKKTRRKIKKAIRKTSHVRQERRPPRVGVQRYPIGRALRSRIARWEPEKPAFPRAVMPFPRCVC
jgi:fatty acid-binding protein DegV